MTIRKATPNDASVVTKLALLLFSGHAFDELYEEFAELLLHEDAVIFLAESEGQPIAFAQCQLRRDYVEGTSTSPVGYLEGVYVKEDIRHHGVARALVSACGDWARSMGCTEFASDCELNNAASAAFHKAIGFAEVNRIICFTKQLC